LPWATIARPIGTPNHEHYARSWQHKVILIGGQWLAELMIEYNVGVSTVRTIALKRVDSDYFDE
jgi:restriction system protein